MAKFPSKEQRIQFADAFDGINSLDINAKVKGAKISCEMTVSIAQFENIKPRIELEMGDVSDEAITKALGYVKCKMKNLYKHIEKIKEEAQNAGS
jgi:hypothetical protein